MYKLPWDSKNVTNITKAWIEREGKIKNVSWPDCEIHFSWENDVIQHLRVQVKSPVCIVMYFTIFNWIMHVADEEDK